MLRFRKIAAASQGKMLLHYFTENTPEPIHPRPVDEQGRTLEDGGRLLYYYTSRDSRATWRPDMDNAFAEAAGIDRYRMPRDEDLIRLFEAKRADNGAAWSKHTRKLSGFDFVFSPDKSVALAAEFAAIPAETAAIWTAIDRANDAAMRYAASILGWARKGQGGEDGADPGAVGWVSFRHHTARPTVQVQDGAHGQTYTMDAPVAGDPLAHIHNFLMNMVLTDNGRVGSLDTRQLTQERVKEIGAVFQAVLGNELRRLGVGMTYDAGEHAIKLTAIPDAINTLFSKREQEIERGARRFAEDQGLDWTDLSAERKLKIMEDASNAGRLGKMKTDERRIWRDQAEAAGWQHQTVMQGVVPEKLTDVERYDRAYETATKQLEREFETSATIVHGKLGMYAARGLIGVGINDPATDIEHVVRLIEERGIRVRGKPVDIIVGLLDDNVRVAHSGQIRIEQDLARLARQHAADRSGALGEDALRQAIIAAEQGMRHATGRDDAGFSAQQKAAIHALGAGGRLSLLTGVAGAGKTSLLTPLVAAWQADRTFGAQGREVIGTAIAWRQADALKDAGIERTYALSPLLRMIEKGEFVPDRNTVLVIDEVSQIGPRSMLRLVELQARTGMTIQMMGDREQAQAIEAGDTIRILHDALPAEALPELLTTVRQATDRARKVSGLFRAGEAATALDMKRADGHAMMVGGDRDQVVARIADLYVRRRDVLLANGSTRGISVTAPTNDDAGDISRAIRERLKRRGEIGTDEVVYRAIDQRGETYDLAIATGDRLRLFRRTWGEVDGKRQEIGSNGDIVEVLGQSARGVTLKNQHNQVAHVAWHRLQDEASGRLLLASGHALTIDAAQGITSDEHINALPRGTAGVTAFKTYVAESRARGITWTMISEGSVYQALLHEQAMGEITPITKDHIWARAAEDMSFKPYKSLATDLIARRAHGVDTFIACRHMVSDAPRPFYYLRPDCAGVACGMELQVDVMYDGKDDVKAQYRRVEVLTGPGRRRSWSADKKARIVAETLAPGARVSDVARRWQVCSSQVFEWRRQAREASASPPMTFVPIVAEAAPPASARPAAAPPTSTCAAIDIRLAGAVLRVAAGVPDTALLTAVLRAVRASASRE